MAKYSDIKGFTVQTLASDTAASAISGATWSSGGDLNTARTFTGRTGGGTMQKPYISSSNYILKMSNYKKGDWSKKWDDLYHSFLKKHNKTYF